MAIQIISKKTSSKGYLHITVSKDVFYQTDSSAFCRQFKAEWCGCDLGIDTVTILLKEWEA